MSNCSCPTQVSIACSLTPSELQDREARWQSLGASYLVRTTRTGSGAVLEFSDADGTVETEVRALAHAEKACCPFFEFSVTREAATVHLGVSAPEDAQTVVDTVLRMIGGSLPHREPSAM